jgi:hypothetical protein
MATKVNELEARVRELEQLLGAQGIRVTGGATVEEGPRPDFVGFGSPQHAALLGLVEVAEGDDVADYVTYTSPASGTTYRLADEYEPVRTFPAMDPEKSARVILRQKIGSLESGEPPVPAHAPEMWQPRDMP